MRMMKLKSTKHEYHSEYQPMYLTEYKGKKFKIQKREEPSTEWDLLIQNLDDNHQCDYENYHWVDTLPTKGYCLDRILCIVDNSQEREEKNQ